MSSKNKMKTHRAAAKRYKATGTGKIVRRKAGKSHLLTHKSAKRKNSLSRTIEVSETCLYKIAVEIPYMRYIR